MRQLKYINGYCPVLIDVAVVNTGGCQEPFVPEVAAPLIQYAQRGHTSVTYTDEPKQKSILINEGTRQCELQLQQS